jgi:hypothetical protein
MGMTNGIQFLSGAGISIFATNSTLADVTIQLSPLCWEVNLQQSFMVPYLIKPRKKFLDWQ